MPSSVNRKDGRTSLRRAQADGTRSRILEAAAAAFAGRGYQNTRIEDVAAEAGVAYPTVYKALGNKPALLSAAVTHAMTGGDGGPLETLDWFQEQLDAPDATTQLRLVARNARILYERAGRLLDVVRVAAAGDEHAAALWRSIDNDRLDRSRTTAKRLATKARLRASVPATGRTLWALTLPELYVLQVHHHDTTADDYERWLADVLIGATLAMQAPSRTRR